MSFIKRVSFYRLETIQQTLAKLVVDLANTKEKLLAEMSKVSSTACLGPRAGIQINTFFDIDIDIDIAFF